jgi:hypothetical protein
MTGFSELSASLETVIRVVQRDLNGGGEHTVWFRLDGGQCLTECQNEPEKVSDNF